MPGIPFAPQSTINGTAKIKPAPSQALDVLLANIDTILLGLRIRAAITARKLA
jgi:hypothetical protein